MSPKMGGEDGLMAAKMATENQSEATKQGVSLPDINQKVQGMAGSRSDPALNLANFSNKQISAPAVADHLQFEHTRRSYQRQSPKKKVPNSDIHEDDEGQERSEGTQTNIGLTGHDIGVTSIKKHKKSASVLNQTHLTEAPQRSGISIRNSPKMSESKNSVVKASV